MESTLNSANAAIPVKDAATITLTKDFHHPTPENIPDSQNSSSLISCPSTTALLEESSQLTPGNTPDFQSTRFLSSYPSTTTFPEEPDHPTPDNTPDSQSTTSLSWNQTTIVLSEESDHPMSDYIPNSQSISALSSNQTIALSGSDRPKPEIMESENSTTNKASGTSEPTATSLTQQYIPPAHQNGLKRKSDISNEDVAGSGPTSKSRRLEYIQPKCEDGSKLESDDEDQEFADSDSKGYDGGSELADSDWNFTDRDSYFTDRDSYFTDSDSYFTDSDSYSTDTDWYLMDSDSTVKSASQEHVSPIGQEGQESGVTVAEHRIIKNDNRQAAVLFPRDNTYRPTNTVTDGNRYRLRSAGFGKDSSEYAAAAGIPNRQPTHLLRQYWTSEHQWRQTNLAPASYPSTRDFLASNRRTMARPGARYPENLTAKGLYNPRSADFGNSSCEYSAVAGIPNRQPAQAPRSYLTSEYQWQGSNIAQASYPPAINSSAGTHIRQPAQSSRSYLTSEYQWQGSNMAEGYDNMAKASYPPATDSSVSYGRSRGLAGVEYPRNDSGAVEQNLHQDPRSSSLSTTFFTASPGENVLAPMRTNPAPLPERAGPYVSHDSKPFPLTGNINHSSQPSRTQLIDSSPADQWPSRQLPSLRACLLPSVYETRSVELRADGQVLGFRQGPTRPPGLPIEPFYWQRAEDAAQELWRIQMLKRERREAEDARRLDDRSRGFRWLLVRGNTFKVRKWDPTTM